VSGGFGKDERRFSIGLRRGTFKTLEEEAEDHDMSVGVYISWKMEEHAREIEARESEEEDD
jgi:hypothetical protein